MVDTNETLTVLDSVTVSVTSIRRTLDPSRIKRLVVAVLKSDAILRPLLGVTATDPRVYPYYQPAAIISDTQKAYITFATTAYPEVVSAVGGPIFTLAIWALNFDTMEAVRDRLVALVGDGAFYTLSDGRVVRGDRIGEHDSFQENTKFHGKQVQVRFGYSAV